MCTDRGGSQRGYESETGSGAGEMVKDSEGWKTPSGDASAVLHRAMNNPPSITLHAAPSSDVLCF